MAGNRSIWGPVNFLFLLIPSGKPRGLLSKQTFYHWAGGKQSNLHQLTGMFHCFGQAVITGLLFGTSIYGACSIAIDPDSIC